MIAIVSKKRCCCGGSSNLAVAGWQSGHAVGSIFRYKNYTPFGATLGITGTSYDVSQALKHDTSGRLYAFNNVPLERFADTSDGLPRDTIYLNTLVGCLHIGLDGGIYTSTPSGSLQTLAYTKHAPDGSVLWTVQREEGTALGFRFGLDVAGNLYGFGTRGFSLWPGEVITKWSANGVEMWSHNLSDDEEGDDIAHANCIAVDIYGNSYIGGVVEHTTPFGKEAYPYACKLSANGVQQWRYSLVGPYRAFNVISCDNNGHAAAAPSTYGGRDCAYFADNGVPAWTFTAGATMYAVAMALNGHSFWAGDSDGVANVWERDASGAVVWSEMITSSGTPLSMRAVSCRPLP
jgi:hypothetical protein